MSTRTLESLQAEAWRRLMDDTSGDDAKAIQDAWTWLKNESHYVMRYIDEESPCRSRRHHEHR